MNPTRLLAAVFLSALAVGDAWADLRVCNQTTSRIGLAIGYRDAQGWVTEGWFNLKANACETIIKGDLTHRYYYVHALDYDRGGEWSGGSFMCTREREFTVRGAENCLARGYERTGFFEIDTGGEQKNWTIQFTDANRTGGQAR